MDVIWTTLTVLITGWLMAFAIATVARGSQPRAFRPRREGLALVWPIVGLIAYLLIVGVDVSLVAALPAFALGGALGYLATWRNGAMPAIGVPLVWTSPWAIALLAMSGAATGIGALGNWVALVEIGLVVLCAAIGFGLGAFGFGVIATQDARRALDQELNPRVVCPACGAAVQAGPQYCPECRQSLPSHCASCGVTLGQGGVACQLCGSPARPPLPEPSPDAIKSRFCHACAVPVSMDDMFCSACGALLAPACPLCGAPATIDDEFCSYCDIDLESAAMAAESGLQATIVEEVESELSGETVTAKADNQGVRSVPDRPAGAVANSPQVSATTATRPVNRFCTSCGTEAKPNSAFCSRCGKALP